MSFEEEMGRKTEQIEAILMSYLPKADNMEFQRTVAEAMNYSVLAGGKRLRPIHTYSLVHDDLPAMDNDEFRRGRQTTHIRFGHAMGILAGDALLNYAFETMLKAADIAEQEPAEEYGRLLKNIVRAQRILAGKAGIFGMVGGQTADVEATEKKERLTQEKLDFIYSLKTAALIEGAMMAGAALAGASEDELKQIEGIAAKVGLAFQIKDDMLDVTSTTQALGKPVFSDEKNQKVTYVSLKGLDECRRLVEEISKEALLELSRLSGRAERRDDFLRQLLTWLIYREK